MHWVSHLNDIRFKSTMCYSVYFLHSQLTLTIPTATHRTTRAQCTRMVIAAGNVSDHKVRAPVNDSQIASHFVGIISNVLRIALSELIMFIHFGSKRI